MNPPWQADVALDREGAARLVEAQCPDLRPARLAPLGAGWDNTAWCVNDAWVFRFPRRRIAAELIETEVRLLPVIAAAVPLPVPVPSHVGRPQGDYPYPFAGYRLLAGRTACAPDLDEVCRARTAEPLGRFLRALHALPVPAGTPPDLIGRSDLPHRARKARERFHHLDADTRGRVAERLDALAVAPPWFGPPRLVHGDLYPRHVLVRPDGTPCGVIDWGDVHAGDPALDLAIAFTLLPAAARDAFADAYGPTDADTWARARFRALYHSLMLLAYGLDDGHPELAVVGARGIAATLG